jgi:hypothetical protein
MENLVQDQINTFFDMIKLIAKRLPDLGELIVQLVLLGLLLVGAWAVFKGHP